MPTRHISKAWRRDQATGRVNLPAQQTRAVGRHRPERGSDRPVRKQHPTKRDVDTNPGQDYHNFIGYFNDFNNIDRKYKSSTTIYFSLSGQQTRTISDASSFLQWGNNLINSRRPTQSREYALSRTALNQDRLEV